MALGPHVHLVGAHADLAHLGHEALPVGGGDQRHAVRIIGHLVEREQGLVRHRLHVAGRHQLVVVTEPIGDLLLLLC
jgi:hypothetical protein